MCVVPTVTSTWAEPDDWYLMSTWKLLEPVVNLPLTSKPEALARLSAAPLTSCDVEAWPMPNGRLHAAATKQTTAAIRTLCIGIPSQKRNGPATLPGHPTCLLGLFDSPSDKHPREVLLVLGAGAQVAGRVQAVGRVLGCLFRLGALGQCVLDRLGPDGRGADVGQPDPPVTVDLLGGRSDDCPVEQPAAKLDVLVRPIGHVENDLGDDLVGREGGRE